MAVLIANKNVSASKVIGELELNLLLNKLYYEKGYDFRGYKKTSLKRRISRRMRLNNIESIEGYIALLDKSPAEYQKLFNDLTIKVTGFFRDGYPFYILRDTILADIISMKLDGQRSCNSSIQSSPRRGWRGKWELNNEIRIWSPGCATGEEPYSVAMLLMDILKDDAARFSIKIFGTDISEDAVEGARLGIYHPSQLEGMKKEYIDAHFIPVENGYRVKYSLRQMVRYGIHNLVTNQPISHLDLILCRNVLIYFDRELQEKVFRDFYYALRPKGYLVLGKSEVILSEKRDAFREISREARVYQKI